VGCPWVGVPYAEQLARKAERVRTAFGGYASLAGVELRPLRPAPRPFGYRNLVKLVARRGREGLRLGVYRPGTHEVVDIRRCAAHQPQVNELLAPLAAILERQRVPTYDERHHTGWLRYAIVRIGGERAAQLLLVVRDRSFAGQRELLAALRGLRGLSSIALNLNDDRGNALLGRRFVRLHGDDFLLDRVGPLVLQSRAGSFVQANLDAARAAYARVLELAAPQPGERAVDLYSGVGAIALGLARAGAQVQGIEASARAVGDASANATRNGLSDARFEVGDASARLHTLVEEGARADLVTLNPPRKGADAGVREAIVALAPARIIYLSCDPDTLARDLDDLAARGYRSEVVEPFDFLPHTEHVEAVALLRKV
jgi:23S rRNA (uracil1939-C5)-methyltransferase